LISEFFLNFLAGKDGKDGQNGEFTIIQVCPYTFGTFLSSIIKLLKISLSKQLAS